MSSGAGIERDLRRILAVQALRAFAYGFGTVILPTALVESGLSDAQVGVIFTAMLAGMALSAVAVGLLGDRVGRRRLYAALLAVMGLAGIVFALTDSVAALVAVALTGTMSTDANESGPITSLEQAMIGQAPAASRIQVFGRYNAVAYLAGAAGALAAGGPGALRDALPSLPADQRWLLLFPLLAVACVVLALRLTTGVESGTARPARPLQRSRANVARLSSLFAIDAFAGGFIVTTFIVYWFERKFGASPLLMSVVIFASGLLQAGSSIVAARIGARFGLLNTMVFSHLPSNVLLLFIPLMPSLGLAIALLLVRFSLSQMDVPTRQAYIAAMVDPEERTAAAAFTNTSRFVARPFGPAIGTALMTNVALGAPFVVAGALKAGYDLLLWRFFRRIELPEEAPVGGSG
ncbi:MAG TPA: MFS transporter [Actinomycetota bacterium]|jgi:MFS family permease